MKTFQTPTLVHRRHVPEIASEADARRLLSRLDLLPASVERATALCRALASGEQLLVLPRVERRLDPPERLAIPRLAEVR